MNKYLNEDYLKLRKCPFCGGEADITYYYVPGFEMMYIPRCKKCRCALDAYSTKQKAIRAWNRRADVAPVVNGKWFDKGSLSCRCDRCGCKSNRESSFCPNCGAKMDWKGGGQR